MDSDLADRVLSVYGEIDGQVSAFRRATGLCCPPGCGNCCTSDNVEATVIEMLPVAQELFRRGEAEKWLERVAISDGKRACVFYAPDSVVPGNGRCCFYAWRPPVCRLFGFAAVKNKYGKQIFAPCVRQKEMVPLAVERALMAVLTGQAVPGFANFSLQIVGLEPALGTRPLPINRAVELALERYGLALQLRQATAVGPKQGDVQAGPFP
jgi:Fe-S-cluster containining protein